MKAIAVIAIVVTVLAGCATPTRKDFIPIGGSRANGTVELAFEYNLLELPQVNGEQALAVATGRCRAWGYTGAEPFGGMTKRCINISSINGNCMAWRVAAEYQCTTAKEPQ